MPTSNPSEYGTLGVPSPLNFPGGRTLGVAVHYPNDIIWFFGGYGFASTKTPGFLGDIWVLNLKANESFPSVYTSGVIVQNISSTTSEAALPSSNDESSRNGSSNIVVIAIVVPISIAVLLLVAVIIARRKNRTATQVTTAEEDGYDAIRMKHQPQATVPVEERQAIEYSEIEIVKRLGGGFFGDVFQAKWRKAIVAVKQLKGVISETSLVEFEAEAKLMKLMNPHPNVVFFFGMCREPLCILTEYVARGSLSSLLTSLTPIYDDLKLKILKGIAMGMYHLSCEKIIHKVIECVHCVTLQDLAARNVLITETYEAKVADFGMRYVSMN